MRTTTRPLTGTALAVVSLGALATPSAYAGDLAALEVYPSSAAPGETVTVNTTACGKNGHGVGDAGSLGAGEFKLAPGTHKEVVVGQFKVPHHTKPGTYAINVSCHNGKTATGDLVVVHGGGGKDTGGKDTGGKDTGGLDTGGMDTGGLDTGGKHTGGMDTGGLDTGGQGDVPSGHVKTGVGGSVGPDTAQIAAGAAVLAAAAVGGVWLLRRRASGAQGR
ncbi:hypothetical protein [Streptomyces sp. NRRL S-118]|uniref:hypothetical protein n=1 Tax=Streptomyces sp. NRRL S-118 TaxID=1463881 RepID=UPI0004CBA14D|nr:hypothetical protein [Streptomyces sp. NRRL S-118]